MAEARTIALRFLGRREYACKELSDKLQRRGLPAAVVAQAVAELAKEELVSDQRFAEAFAHSRVTRLYGPLRIRAELIKRGIDSSLISQVLDEYAGQWQLCVRQWIEKRMGPELNRKEKARLYRSSTNRGFKHEHVMRALDLIGSGQ